MKNKALIVALCLCFAVFCIPAQSATVATNATTKATTKTTKAATGTPTTKGTASNASTNPPGATNAPASSKTQTTKATTPAPVKYNCSTFSCIGKNCAKNATKTACSDNFCVITTFTNGSSYVTVDGSCANACKDKKTGDHRTLCCQKNSCNTDTARISDLIQPPNGGQIWTLSAVVLIIVQALIFVLE